MVQCCQNTYIQVSQQCPCPTQPKWLLCWRECHGLGLGAAELQGCLRSFSVTHCQCHPRHCCILQTTNSLTQHVCQYFLLPHLPLFVFDLLLLQPAISMSVVPELLSSIIFLLGCLIFFSYSFSYFHPFFLINSTFLGPKVGILFFEQRTQTWKDLPRNLNKPCCNIFLGLDSTGMKVHSFTYSLAYFILLGYLLSVSTCLIGTISQ